MLSVQGFTLIEMVITLVIIAVLASIAMPNYQRYQQQNIHAQAQQLNLNIANQLTRWRAKTLTYHNFVAQQQLERGAVIYIPSDSDERSYRYKTTIDVSDGNTWQIIAQPNNNLRASDNSPIYYMNSLGQRCRFAYPSNIATGQQLYYIGAQCRLLGARHW